MPSIPLKGKYCRPTLLSIDPSFLGLEDCLDPPSLQSVGLPRTAPAPPLAGTTRSPNPAVRPAHLRARAPAAAATSGSSARGAVAASHVTVPCAGALGECLSPGVRPLVVGRAGESSPSWPLRPWKVGGAQGPCALQERGLVSPFAIRGGCDGPE